MILQGAPLAGEAHHDVPCAYMAMHNTPKTNTM